MLNLFFSAAAAYLVGSIPTAYIFGKLLKGVDIRTIGSGNVGATNIYRTIGKGPGFIVLFLDIIKGAVPVLILRKIFPIDPQILGGEVYGLIIGASAIIGHTYTIFLGFKGGKGVATSAGVLCVLAPEVLLIALAVWILFLIPFHYVSVSSIAAAASLPISSWILHKTPALKISFLVLAAIGIYKHKSNIERLLKGKEHKIF